MILPVSSENARRARRAWVIQTTNQTIVARRKFRRQAQAVGGEATAGFCASQLQRAVILRHQRAGAIQQVDEDLLGAAQRCVSAAPVQMQRHQPARRQLHRRDHGAAQSDAIGEGYIQRCKRGCRLGIDLHRPYTHLGLRHAVETLTQGSERQAIGVPVCRRLDGQDDALYTVIG